MTVGTDNASINITDDDSATVSIAATTQGNETLPTDGLFTVTQTAESSTDTVLTVTPTGTALNGTDYTALAGTVTITAGTTSATITIDVTDDAIVEDTETVTLTIAKSAGDTQVTVGTDNASINITDDDYNLTISNPGTGSGTVDVSTGGVSRGTISLSSGSTSADIGTKAGDLVVLSNPTAATTPDPGSIFKTYSENSFTMPSADKNVTATFNQQWKITAFTADNGHIYRGGVLIDPPSLYELVEQGQSSSVYTIAPGEGYYFKLFDNGSLIKTFGDSDTYQITNVTANHDINVSFHANPTITPSAGANGDITPDDVQPVSYGSNETTFEMKPGDGFCVEDVKVNGGSQGDITTYTFTDITSDQTIDVTFRGDFIFTGYIEPFMATAAWGGPGKWMLKKTDGTPLTDWLDHNDTVLIPCDVNDFIFEIKDVAGWTRDDADGSIAFTTPATSSLIAKYKPNLTTAANGSGTIAPAVSNQARTFNEIVTLEPTPAAGYKFARWEGDVVGIEDPTSITMSEPRTVTAVFVAATAFDNDDDLDGFSEAAGDCNDADGSIYPGAVDVCEDGIDQDCTGADLPCVLEKVCLDISDVPVDTQLQAAPANIMFVIDDSGSMDWEFITSESGGTFHVGTANYNYIFPDPGNDNNYGGILSTGNRPKWKSQWHEYNRMYYKPGVKYTPWPGLPDADPDNPKTDPTKTYTLPMGDTFLSVATGGSVDVTCADCVVVDDEDIGGGLRTIVRVNQQSNGGVWTKLGDFDFKAGSSTGDYTNTGARVVVTRESSTVGAGDGQFLLPTNSSSTSADAVKLKMGVTEYIVDNGAAGWSKTGTWSNSSGPDSYGTTSYYSSSTGGKGIYDFTLAATGTYEVWVRWTVAGTRPTNAPYTIYHASAAADPAKLFTSTGPWLPYDASGAYQNHYLYTNSGGTAFTATWTANNLVAGQEYDVYAQWKSGSSRSGDVLYTISDTTAATDPTYHANQKINGGKWNKIASGLKFNGSANYSIINVSGKVTLSHTPAASSSDRASADAVAFVPAAGTVTTDPTIINAHYFVKSSVDNNVYLVNLDGSITYYKFNDDGDDYVESLEMVSITNDEAQTAGIIPLTKNSAVLSSAGTAADTTLAITELNTAPPDDTLFVIEGDSTLYTIGTGSTTTELAITPVLSADAVAGAVINFYRTYTEERQNFANWYSFYRRREFTAKAAIARVITELSGVQVGFQSLWRRLNQPALKVKVTQGGVYEDYTNDLLDDLYDMDADNGTPLRIALLNVGRYYHQSDGQSGYLKADETSYSGQPWYDADNGGTCQQSFAIVITDGFWNGSSPNVGNQDGGKGVPYADSYSSTLADVAMKYYSEDLVSDLDDQVPTNFIDSNQQQHMVTYGISFGVTGTLDPNDYDLFNSDPDLRVYPTWPSPYSGSDQRKIDDLWHASINGRGYFLSAGDPEELINVLTDVVKNVVSRIGSGASVSINGEELHAGTVIFQASYSTDGWTGDVKAFDVDLQTGQVDTDTPLWSASAILGEGDNWDNTDWNTERVIATYDDATGVGVAFRYDSLNAAQKSSLDADAAIAQNKLKYIRGSNANEEDKGGTFRNRTAKLGDLVHSSPLYQSYDDATGTYGMLYVGGNDGMLHAFYAGESDTDPDNGKELFAYVPNHVFPNLSNLTLPNINHKFYVDVTPFVRQTDTETLLVGGLGKGGKGYYALDVTNPRQNLISESNLSWVKWEFPRPGEAGFPQTYIDNLGYSMGRAFIVKSNDASVPWLVIFGNGYDSKDQCAVLYILDASNGQVVNLIKTSTTACTDCNGLSAPNPVDVDGDFKVDYVYAGDLQGNLWKFDLTSSNKSEWGVAYKDGSTPKPLFTAKGPGGTVQPITAMPSIMRHPDFDKSGYMVLFGTGKYLDPLDLGDTSLQTLYGIWDYGDDGDDAEYLGTFNRESSKKLSNQPEEVSLLMQEDIFFEEVAFTDFTRFLRVLSQNPIVWDTDDDAQSGQEPNPSAARDNHAGWYFDVPLTAERVVRDGLIRDGNYIVITSIPKSSPCSAGGDSIVHEMNAGSGGRLDVPLIDINESFTVDEGDLIEIPNPDYVEGGEEPATIKVAPTGIHFRKMLHSPAIMRMSGGQTEKLIFSSSSSDLVQLSHTAEDQGMTYWLEH